MALSKEQVGIAYDFDVNVDKGKAKLKDLNDATVKGVNDTVNKVNQAGKQLNFESVFRQLNQLRIGVTQLSRGDTGGLPNLANALALTSTGLSAGTLAAGGLVAGLAAVGVGAAALEAKAISLTLEMSKLAGHLDDLSKETGLSPEFLQRMETLGKLTDVKLDTITTAFEKFERVIVGADEGSKNAQRSMQKLGITAKEAAEDPEAAFKKLLKVLADNQGSAAATELAYELAGKGGAKLLRLAEENAKAAKNFGQILDEEAVRTLAALDDEVDNLGVTTDRVKGLIAKEVAPQVIGAIHDIEKALGENEGAFQDFGQAVATTLLGLRGAALVAAQDFRIMWLALKGDAAGLAQAVANYAGLDEFIRGAVIEDEIQKALRLAQGASGGGKKPPIKNVPRGGGGKSEFNATLGGLRADEKSVEFDAQQEIAVARRLFDERKLSIERLERITIEAEKKMLAAKEATFAAERQLIENSKLKASEKAEKLAELANREKEAQLKADNEIARVQAERRKIEEQIDQTTSQAKAERDETALRAEIDRIQLAADRRVISYENAANRIEEVERVMFATRRERLETELKLAGTDAAKRAQITEEIKKLDQELALSAEQAFNRRIEAQKRDLQALDAYLKARNQLLEETRRAEVDQLERNARLLEQQAQGRPGLRLAATDARQRADVEAENLAHTQALNRIEEEIDAARKLGLTKRQELDLQAQRNKLEEAEEQRHQDALNAIKNNARQQTLLNDPSSPLSIFGQAGQDAADAGAGRFGQFEAAATSALTKVGESAGNMETILTGAFGNIAGGLEQMIEAFLLTGETGPAAFLKLARGVIAGVTAQSAVKAIFEVAEGIADQAKFAATLDPRWQVSSALHFASAKFYGLLADVGAAASLALGALGGGGGSSKDEFHTGGAGTREKQTIEQGNRTSEPIVIHLRTEVAESTILRVVERDYRDNGRMRAIVRSDVLGENAG